MTPDGRAGGAVSEVCRHPSYEPSKANPGGDCRGPAVRAVALGDTGRWLQVCEDHAGRYRTTIPIEEVPEP